MSQRPGYSRQQKPHGAVDQRYLRITYGHIVCVVPIINSRGKFVFLINPFVGITLNFSELISVWIIFLLCSLLEEVCCLIKPEMKRAHA